MHILYFYQYFTTPQGAWSTRVYEFAKRWVAAGHQVTVITSPYDKSDLQPARFVDSQRFDGIDVKVINIKISNQKGKAARVLGFLGYAIMATLVGLKTRADVVIASSGPLTVGVPGRLVSFFRRRPMILEVRDVWPDGAIELGVLKRPLFIKLARVLESWCYRGSAAIVALSPGMKDVITTRVGSVSIDVVPNASDHALFDTQDRAQNPEDAPFALYAGSLGRMDGAGMLVDVAAALKRLESTIRIVVFGSGADQNDMEREIARLGLSNITIKGLHPKRELVPWFQHALCSLVIFEDTPAMNTVSPNKLFDAFAAGLPVIQTTNGWIKSLLAEEKCGLTVARDNPGEIAVALDHMLHNHEARATMAAASKALGREQFDRDGLATDMLRVVSRVTGKST